MMTYTWNCKTVDVYPTDGEHADVVYNVHWIVYGENDESYSATSIGTQMLSVDHITEFIPFEDLTNDQLVDWTKGAMGPELVADIEAGVAAQVAEKENPTTETKTITG